MHSGQWGKQLGTLEKRALGNCGHQKKSVHKVLEEWALGGIQAPNGNTLKSAMHINGKQLYSYFPPIQHIFRQMLLNLSLRLVIIL